QLAADPHSRLEEADPHFVSLEPIYNRCIVFETTEESWHGFERIQIPEGGPASRKSVAVYFYSQTRPLSEVGNTHSTVYKNRPLPSRFKEGYQLNREDEQILQNLLTRRDHHIGFMYKRESYLLSELEKQKVGTVAKGVESLESQPLEPKGFVRSVTVKNLYEDKWVGPELEIQAMSLAHFSRFVVKGWTPGWSPEARSMSVYLNDKKIKELSVVPGKFNFDLEVPLQPRQMFLLKIECSLATVPKSLGISEDLRPLSWLLDSATFDV
ncbi:MAG: hypothetical protein K2X47_17110, partial [Bdellovibrionales bacterium]|nr:hypothetical protein [Bdellovibrionales bacterium]